MQAEGIEYSETYSPTVRFESIRLMLAAAASEGMHMEQLDVTTAFLYATLEEEVYVRTILVYYPNTRISRDISISRDI